jgi:RND superfamily putative drug exporter
MNTSHSFFDPLNALIRKRYRAIVVAWVLILLVSAPLVSSFFSSVSFNVSGSSLSVPNSESDRAQAVLNSQFPSMNFSENSVIVVLQNHDVYSSDVKSGILSLNRTLATDSGLPDFTGITSIYSVEENLLDSSVPAYVRQIAQIAGQIPGSGNGTIAWNQASRELAEGVSDTFGSSPLFTVNATSLYDLLAGLKATSSPGQIHSSIASLLASQDFGDYPYKLSSSLTQDFASHDGKTMIFDLGFSSAPSHAEIIEARTEVHNSSLASVGTLYVTGGDVIAVDFEASGGPALSDSIIPGIAISLLVAGLLFLSPVAAIVPLLVGGVAIGISLGSIYGLIVYVQNSQINFAVPFLMILTMLGLAVDYSVLQLRRTREELSKGKPLQESVAISVRWAGQAVLTAGLTVVVAYIVLAVTRVPFFGAVGTAIALGVAILLAASLTLLPSLELLIAKRLFWPRHDRLVGEHPSVARRRLDSVPDKVLRHKIAISIVIGLLALGAFYVAYETPTGIDFSRLIPNFESNQGITVITDNLGGSVVSPTLVIVTFPTAIIYGQDQFNQTLLKEIESISSTISGSSGVDSVSSPTRPYGHPFNFTDLAGLTTPVRAQYLSGMTSLIGRDNKTALITVGFSQSAESSTTVSDLGRIEASVDALPLPQGTNVYFGGDTQSIVDSVDLVNGVLPTVVLILAVGVFLILFVQLRSVFTPLRLIYTLLCSVAFALATLSILFYYLLQTPIVIFAPLFVVVTMLGVGVDYDIFLVTRIREEAMGGMTDVDAIKTAMNRTWVTLLGLGLILSSVFGALIISGIGLFQEIGLSAASAIMVDVGVIIFLFVPSLMAIAQKYNWWPGKVREEARQIQHEK